MSNRDDEMASIYSDPENRKGVGAPRKKPQPERRLTQHVPIRFSAETIGRARMLADRAGLTVSSWIRRLVEQEIQRELAKENQTRAHLRDQFVVASGQPDVPTHTTRNPEEVSPKFEQLGA